jgi:hypothetical protein
MGWTITFWTLVCGPRVAMMIEEKKYLKRNSKCLIDLIIICTCTYCFFWGISLRHKRNARLINLREMRNNNKKKNDCQNKQKTRQIVHCTMYCKSMSEDSLISTSNRRWILMKIWTIRLKQIENGIEQLNDKWIGIVWWYLIIV